MEGIYFSTNDFSTTEATMPKHFIIEPTNYCNYSCIMCPNRWYTPEQKGMMRIDDYKKIIDRISSFAKVIQLYWVGEPLLHPSIIEMIKYAKQETNAVVVLSTNASLLTASIAHQLFSSKIDIVIISLDAITSNDVYSAIRCNGQLNSVLKQVHYFIDNNKTIDIQVQLLSLKKNQHDREIAKQYFAGKQCKIRYSWIDTWAGTMPELSEAADELSPLLNVSRMPCADLWNKATIGWDGQVYLCCHDWKRSYSLGSVVNTSLYEIWNAEKIKEIRRAHIENRYERIQLCYHCSEWAVIEEYGTFLE